MKRFMALSDVHEQLEKEWDLEGNLGLKPDEVSAHSNMAAWWKNKNGERYQQKISERTKQLQPNKSIPARLQNEWHPSKNGHLTPESITSGSNKKVWWLCDKGHEWQSIVKSRHQGAGCPYCTNKKASPDNNLQAAFPHLMAEWNYKKNADLSPHTVTFGSAKKAWWTCNNGHEWETSINNRTQGKGCPYCSGRKVSQTNNLAHLNPAAAKQWHPTKNGALKPTDVTAGSGKKVWWNCAHGHEWETTIKKRSEGYGCPHCAIRKVSQTKK